MPKMYIYGAVGLVILGLIVALQLTQAKLETAEIKRDIAIEQRDTMYAINQQILEAKEKDDVLRRQLYADYKGARDEAEEFRAKLADSDLSAAAKGRPTLVTRYARRATERVLRDIEAAANSHQAVPESTGAGHTETETSPPDGDGD